MELKEIPEDPVTLVLEAVPVTLGLLGLLEVVEIRENLVDLFLEEMGKLDKKELLDVMETPVTREVQVQPGPQEVPELKENLACLVTMVLVETE